MPTRKSPRKGSLQFWPRKRARKFLPRVNWNAIPNNSQKGLKGFICYKAGMMSGSVVDNTPNSMAKGKEIVIPLTILECPPVKIFSVRFYKNNKVAKEILSKNLDKELKRKIKIPKKSEGNIDAQKDYDDLRIIVYSIIKKTNIKKTPDISEIGLVGSLEEKLNFIKENINKEISVLDIFQKGQIVDIRGLTKGKGFSGPTKIYGLSLRQHKSEKGRRGPGSLGPWHPARVTFRAPQAGQLGTFTRIAYNKKIIDIGSVKDNLKLKGFKRFGDVKSDYILLKGSVQGPPKRQLLISCALRETKKQSKKNYEFIGLTK